MKVGSLAEKTPLHRYWEANTLHDHFCTNNAEEIVIVSLSLCTAISMLRGTTIST